MTLGQKGADGAGSEARFSGFGYAVHEERDPHALDEMLRAVADAGFTHADIWAGLWDVLIGGRVNGHELSRWIAVLDRHRDDLRFTFHGPSDLNLFDTTERELHERLLLASLELAKAVGAEAIAYHPGVRLKPPIGAAVAMLDLMQYEREMLLAVADEVSAWGGKIGIETWWAVGDDGYSYAIWPDQLAGQVEAIGHPAIGACLDFGHLFLAARWFGFDFLEGVARLAPHVNHFHVQDLFGVLAPTANVELGHGDLHLPPGWGEIPFDDVFSRIAFPRTPVFTIELAYGRGARFRPHLRNMLFRMSSTGEPSPTRPPDLVTPHSGLKTR
jgi:sugar phosphate isomerase/epimerase